MRSCSTAIAFVGVLLACAADAQTTGPTIRRPPTHWICQNDARNRIVATFLDSDPPSAILERGGKRVIAVLQKSGSGAKYVASDGTLFWVKGKSALVEWPAGKSFSCVSLE